MAWTTIDGWAGRVWVSKSGKRTFYIRQYRDGKRWDASTSCSTLRGAMKELERFEQDPAGYRPAGSGEQLVLDDALTERYVAWCRERTDAEDERWLQAKRRSLAWWQVQLAGKPLNAVKLSRLFACLERATGRRDRIVTIKHLYSWLRQTDQLAASDDPTLDALPVPQGRPEQDTSGESKVIDEADFRVVLGQLDQGIADLCRVMAGTGCHLSEALRLHAGGRVEDRPAPPPSVSTGATFPAPLPVLCFKHKGGHIHRVEVGQGVADAARRLIGSRAPARETVYKAIRRACAAAGVEQWTPGRFRHTFATHAIARGVAPSAVALALGHKGPATSLRWYATTAVAPRVDSGYEA